MSERVEASGAGRRQPIPGLVWATCGLAVAILAALAVAVVAHLRSAPHPSTAMQMGHSTSEAFYRAGPEPHGPLLSAKLFTAWQLDAVALAILLVAGAAYLCAVTVVRRRGDDWPARFTASFVAGLVVCALATNSSIAVYDMSLFTAHMIGHLMLVMLAPALLVAGRPLSLAVAASRNPDRILAISTGRVVSLLTAPPVALASYAVVIVATHLTGLMDVIMRHTWTGQVEHLAYVVLGCQFFVVVLGDAPLRWQLSVPARFFMLAISMAVDTFTGVVLLQSGTAIHMTPPPGASINPLTDTQTGGAIMWFGGDGIMAVIMVIMVFGWIHRAENRQVEPGGWLEQARRTSFATNTGVSGEIAEDFDDDEQRLRQYNEWLQRLDSHQ